MAVKFFPESGCGKSCKGEDGFARCHCEAVTSNVVAAGKGSGEAIEVASGLPKKISRIRNAPDRRRYRGCMNLAPTIPHLSKWLGHQAAISFQCVVYYAPPEQTITTVQQKRQLARM